MLWAPRALKARAALPLPGPKAPPRPALGQFDANLARHHGLIDEARSKDADLVVGAVLLYPIGIFLGGMSPGAFVALCAPAQAVAFAARSSLASLPAMVESAQIAKMPPVVNAE